MSEKFTELKNSFTNAIDGLGTKIENALSSLLDGLLEGIKDIFVPSEDYVSDRWDSIRAKFSFADSISETAGIIVRFFKETAFNEPPKIYIDLGKAESKYDYGGQTYCLDMVWYERYKPTVDVFLSAWIWLVFLFRVYTKLPAIINGVAGDFELAADIRDFDNYRNKAGGFKSYGQYRDTVREIRKNRNYGRWRK